MRISHSSAVAHENAIRLGLSPTERDFVAAFLSITDALLGEPSTARYVGPTRDAERWTVLFCGREVDVIYYPDSAVISGVLRPLRPSDAAMVPAGQPSGPRPQAAELVA